MKIDDNEVKYVAKLAKIRFTDDELKKLADDFQSILTHFESIDKLDLSDIKLDLYKPGMKSVLRHDEVAVFEDKKKLFQNVKSMSDTSIRVPKIIDE